MQNSKIRKTFKDYDYENEYDEKIIIKKNLSGSQRRKNKQKRLVQMIGNYLDFGNSSGNELIKKILLFHPVTFDYFKQQRIKFVRQIQREYLLSITKNKYQNSRTPWYRNYVNRPVRNISIPTLDLTEVRRRLVFENEIKSIEKDIKLCKQNIIINRAVSIKERKKTRRIIQKIKKKEKNYQKRRTQLLNEQIKIKYTI
jgi:hypothetical protein